MKKLRVFEAFAGYGSQMMALRRLEKDWGIEFVEPVGISEIEKAAIDAYHAVHGDDIKNYGDIAKIDWSEVPDFDLFTYSFPCTDISQAGQQKGLAKGSGTRSGLLWECAKAIEAKKPKYLLMENVKALTSKKFMPDFQKWLNYLESLDYQTTWMVMNAKDYGVPQNRERCFAVSILKPVEHKFQFPAPWKLDKGVEDILEDEVDDKYYISDEIIDKFGFDAKFGEEFERIKKIRMQNEGKN